jgi:hypothetical protein
MSKDDIDELAEEAGGAVRGVPISRILAHIAAQAATIALLRAECRAWRDWNDNCGVDPHDCRCDDVPRGPNLIAARAAVDSDHALEDNA